MYATTPMQPTLVEANDNTLDIDSDFIDAAGTIADDRVVALTYFVAVPGGACCTIRRIHVANRDNLIGIR
jgi:hypothetical protein